MVLDEPDARKYRAFLATFSRDRLLPFFKTRRGEFLQPGTMLPSGRYVAAAEVFAWYYNLIANGVTEDLVAAEKIKAPDTVYTYAVRAPQ